MSCKDFVFNFSGADVDGNVIINIPNVGEVFCGEAGTTSNGSSYTNTSTATAYTATKQADGSYNLAPAQVTPEVAAAYQTWLKTHPSSLVLLI